MLICFLSASVLFSMNPRPIIYLLLFISQGVLHFLEANPQAIINF